jgi:D-arginine dehydrogenase
MANVAELIVIGAGIAGASVAAAVAAHYRGNRKVILLEREDAPGYHSTGRSAAIYIQNYGPPDVRLLTQRSRSFFDAPPAGFTEVPLGTPRGVLFVAPDSQREEFAGLLAEGDGLQEISRDKARELVPALKPDYVRSAAFETDAFDIDVAALHQGFLRQLRAHSGVIATRQEVSKLHRAKGCWHVQTTRGETFEAPVIVNAAGAWCDEIATSADLGALGFQPTRRTGVILDPQPWVVRGWPLVGDAAHTWYVRPEARTRLMVSPADETDVPPHDVQPEELDIAIAIERMREALAIDVRQVERSWAGLRTFSPDGSLVIGWDKRADGFFWLAGQGGYGIQTAPAVAMMAADLLLGRDVTATASIAARVDPNRFV